MKLYSYDFTVRGYGSMQTVYDCKNKEDAIEKIKEGMGCRRCDIDYVGNKREQPTR